MQYERITDTAAIVVNETGESQLSSASLDKNKSIIRIRRALLILIATEWILCLVTLAICCALMAQNDNDTHKEGLRLLGPILMSLIYHGAGVVVVYRYHKLGIYIYAWLGIAEYLFLFAVVFLEIVFIVKHPARDKPSTFALHASVLHSVITMIHIILDIIVLRLSFKFNRLLKMFQRDVVAEV